MFDFKTEFEKEIEAQLEYCAKQPKPMPLNNQVVVWLNSLEKDDLLKAVKYLFLECYLQREMLKQINGILKKGKMK